MCMLLRSHPAHLLAGGYEEAHASLENFVLSSKKTICRGRAVGASARRCPRLCRRLIDGGRGGREPTFIIKEERSDSLPPQGRGKSFPRPKYRGWKTDRQIQLIGVCIGVL